MWAIVDDRPGDVFRENDAHKKSRMRAGRLLTHRADRCGRHVLPSFSDRRPCPLICGNAVEFAGNFPVIE